MADIRYPQPARDRGLGYWLRPRNILASQKFLRLDYSNEWRYSFGAPNPLDRSVRISDLITPAADGSFRFVILGDTGEGDRSQFGLVPLIRALKPDFMIINGDVAYPAGRAGSGNRDDDDFLCGFFEPYRNLDIPIWATPGNHEYYSPGNGQEFHEVFCTRKLDRTWAEYGLKHSVLQPGMYWELRDDRSKLAIIGLDTGKKANLDGDNDWWQIWKRRIEPDKQQHAWLDERLRRAEERDDRVIVLFHIPALVNEKHAEKYLGTLHRIIAAYPRVEAVVCGHEHSFQKYSASTFQRYLKEKHTGSLTPRANPHYFVSGSSGAALASTAFDPGEYQSERFPTADQWRAIARLGRIAVNKARLGGTAAGDILGRLQVTGLDDGDAAVCLSLLLVEVAPAVPPERKMKVTITPVLMNDLKDLFTGVGDDVVIDVTGRNLPINPAQVAICRQRQGAVTLRD